MKRLLRKNFKQSIITILIITLCSLPFSFYIMKYYYTEDLDELIEYRSNNFIKEHLPKLGEAQIAIWNEFNEDMKIIPYSPDIKLQDVQQETFYNASEQHDIDYRIIYTPIKIDGKPYVLGSRIALIENHDLLSTLFVQYGSFFIFLFTILTIVEQIQARKLWKPFYSTLDKVTNFNLEKDEFPEFDPTDTYEFDRLNNILTALITADLELFNQQKEFIQNASHELQTPLAIFQSQLDILLQDNDLTESQMRVLQTLYQVSLRMTRLNKNLLLLARIDSYQYAVKEKTNLIEILNTQLTYIENIAIGNEIEVKVDLPKDFYVHTNRTLLESLVNNLLTNAIRHNIDGGEIDIQMKKTQLLISNTGVQNALDSDKIFRRFYRSDKEKNSNGLGLPIVLQICNLHGWKISYHYEHQRHCFIVDFETCK